MYWRSEQGRRLLYTLASTLNQNFLNVAHGFEVNHHKLHTNALSRAYKASTLCKKKSSLILSNHKKRIALKPKMTDATCTWGKFIGYGSWLHKQSLYSININHREIIFKTILNFVNIPFGCFPIIALSNLGINHLPISITTMKTIMGYQCLKA